MELTLIPILAVLLLLSGSVTSAHLGHEQAAAAARLRGWFSNDEPAQHAPRGSLHIDLRSCSLRHTPGAAHRSAAASVAQRARAVASELSQTRRHSRFGVATAAYRPAAPPLA